MSVEIKNKKASFTYFLEDEFTAGIQLNGCEIKSIRNGKASIAEEIKKLDKKLKNVGITLVPTLLFISKSGYAKIKFSIAKGKKMRDKRAVIKERDVARDMDRSLR